MAFHADKKHDLYKIPDEVELIIVDAHDTVLKRDLAESSGLWFGNPEVSERIVWVVREGLLNFLTVYSKIFNKKVVISSDGNRNRLQEHFERFGVSSLIARVYGAEHLEPSTQLKNLSQICKDFGVTQEKAIFIGDSHIDENAADKHGIQFIRVPNTLEDRYFTFNYFLNHLKREGVTGLEILGIRHSGQVYFNLTTAELYEKAFLNGEGKIAHDGPLVIQSGEYKKNLLYGYIVREPSTENKIWWGHYHRDLDRRYFDVLYARLLAYLQGKNLYVQDSFCGTDSRFNFPIRIITETAWHSLFARNLLVEAKPKQIQNYFPEYTIIHVPNFYAIPEIDGTDDKAFVVVNFLKKVAIVGGTAYAGELRTCLFTIMNHILPHSDVLPLLCSANTGSEGDVTLFFGNHGTGKTTLSLDVNRPLIGDTFHGWSEDGIFNLEWGCYARVTGYNAYNQSHIYECTKRFGTLLENACMNESRRVDFNNTSISENIHAVFPFTHLKFADRSGRGNHPSNIILLIRDGYGIFPSIAKLTPEQACYHFLCGYSTDIEYGVSGAVEAVKPQFNSCFGSFSNVLHPTVYANFLYDRICKHELDCWLVNTGWLGDYKTQGHSSSVMMTRLILNGIYTDILDDTEFDTMPIFGLKFPIEIEGTAPKHTNVKMAWKNQEDKYLQRIEMVAKLFVQTFQPYEKNINPEIKNAGPRVALRRG